MVANSSNSSPIIPIHHAQVNNTEHRFTSSLLGRQDETELRLLDNLVGKILLIKRKLHISEVSEDFQVQAYHGSGIAPEVCSGPPSSHRTKAEAGQTQESRHGAPHRIICLISQVEPNIQYTSKYFDCISIN